MPYCLACGTKTDFETVDCPDCGQAVPRRIDPPGDDVVEVPEPRLHWDEGDENDADEADTNENDADEGDAGGDGDGIEHATATATESASETDAEVGASRLTGIAETPTWAEPDDAEPSVETAPSADEADDERDLTTDPADASPFADRWSLSFATGYPVRSGYRPLVGGGIVEFIALVLPVLTLFTAGYGFRVLRAVARGQDEPPAFEDYGQLLVEGMKFSLVVVLYSVVAFFGAVAAIIVQAVDEPFGIALWLTLGVLVVYPLPASLTVCGATDEFRTAFTREYAGEFAVSWTYLKAWLAWLVSIVAVSIVTAVSLITLVGPVVVRAWSIYSFGALWGYYYRQAAARGVVPPAPDGPVR